MHSTLLSVRHVWLIILLVAGSAICPEQGFGQDIPVSSPKGTGTVGSQPGPLAISADTTLTAGELKRQQKKAPRVFKKKQKSLVKKKRQRLWQEEDSIKTALQQQLQARPAARQIDSVKNVINNAETTARQELQKTKEYQQFKEGYAAQINLYEENKNKLVLLKADSTTIASEVQAAVLKELNNTAEAQRIKEDIKPYIDSPFLQGIKLQDLDSMNTEDLQKLRQQVYKNVEEHYVNKMLERKEFIQFKQEKAELEALKGLPEVYKKQFEAYKNGVRQVKDEALLKAVKEAQKVLAKNLPQVNKAQQSLAKLKKKYSAVPNTSDLSSAVKRNSLKDKPFKSRLVLGGNFQVITTGPVILDISPLLGYRFNKDFHVAIGGTYRARFSSADSTFIRINYGRDELTYGYRAFANYRFWKVFYLHAEYERINKAFEVKGTDRFARQWKPGALAGIGTTYTIKGALKGNVSLLYNFLHDDRQRVYQSPWVFRFGLSR